MKVMKLNNSVAVLIIACSLTVLSPQLFSVAAGPSPGTITEPQADPGTSLSRGRSLLKQGHADQALGLLETAQKLYTQANNPRGIAASEDALGDLFIVQGQYKVALDHYQKAHQAFVTARGKDDANSAATNSAASLAGGTASAAAQTANSLADNGFNANLMLAKIGDTNY